MNREKICWYTRRDELEPGQVFKCLGDLEGEPMKDDKATIVAALAKEAP